MDNTVKDYRSCWQGLTKEGIQVAPSLLAADFAHLAEDVSAVEAAGARALHLDVMDGHFVPNISFGSDVIKSLRPGSKMLFDTHLMISHPLQYIKRYVDAGSQSITFHVECDDDVKSAIDMIHGYGCAAGLSLRPGTPASALLPYLKDIELVLVMTVEPGFGGQAFHYEQLPKIGEFAAAISEISAEHHVVLEVDGGVNAETAPLCRQNGTAVMVAGSSVFKHKGQYREAIAALL